MDRRTFLGTGAAAAAAALAGCSTAVGAVAPPDVPEDQLSEGGWEQTEQSLETVFEREILGQSIEAKSHTLVFEDRALREAVRDATDGAVDQSWRFFFATRLRFRPPLAPGVGTAMVLPTVKSEGVRSFVADLDWY